MESTQEHKQKDLRSAIRQGVSTAHRLTLVLRVRATWLASKMQPGPRKNKKGQQKPYQHRSWIDKAIDGAFLVVTSVAFLVFLVASLPHVAYFFAAFEPQNQDGTLSDWWWFVAYLIAGAINITEFLLSIKFARQLRDATQGLPFYQKVFPTLGIVLKYWPFMLIISGFSWAANLQHAREFHSSMLSIAESVSVSIPFFPQIKTWADFNPYIVSAFPILNIAYTLMFDSSRHEERRFPPETLPGESSASTDVQPVSERAQVTVSDFTQLLHAMQAINTQQVQAMHEMHRESLKVTVETLQHLAGVKAGTQQKVTAPHLKPIGKKPEAARRGSAYEEPIKALLIKHPHMSATEAGKRVGCSHVTASAILKTLRPVTVTQVHDDVPLQDESGTQTFQPKPLQDESA